MVRSSVENPWILLLSGAIAGAISRTATAPLDRLKVLLQAGNPYGIKPYLSMTEVCRGIIKEGGFLSFYRGNGANVVNIAPETAIKFWAYENIKHILIKRKTYQQLSIIERFIAGASAGLIAQLFVYPLEITKTRLAVGQSGEYKGIIHCIQSILKTEGFLGLYRGLIPALTGIIPYSGVDLAVYSWLKDKYTQYYPYSTPGAVTLLSCGAMSSTCGQVVAYPLVLIRTKLQTQGMRNRPVIYNGTLDCFNKIWKEEGIRGFYRGILPNFMKAVPAISISYLVYEKAKKFLENFGI